MSIYRLRYFFEWGGRPCLWADDNASRDRFGLGGVHYDDLPLSNETKQLACELAAWHDTALNWEYPPDPGPWRQPECDRFNEASKQLLGLIRTELGDDFDVVDHQPLLAEDPHLDEYLENPSRFRRR